jgi:hypothetical protein
MVAAEPPVLPDRAGRTQTAQKLPLDLRALIRTTAPNAVVEPIHPKAMPVILTTDEERDVWMPSPVCARARQIPMVSRTNWHTFIFVRRGHLLCWQPHWYHRTATRKSNVDRISRIGIFSF